MELRSCDHLHFIQAIKGGLVTKIFNVTRDRPALIFKKVKDVYEAADAKNHDLLPTLSPKDEFEILLFESDRIEVKSSPYLHMADRRTIKREPETSDLFCNDGDKRIYIDSDDLELGSMTLKQITERCNAKKRERSKCFELSKETGETSSCLKSDYSNFRKEEEDLDLKQPLSSWKCKRSKNMKMNEKRMKNHFSTSSQSAKSIVKSEQVPSDEVLPQSSGDLPAINIKETAEISSFLRLDYSNFQKEEEDLDLMEPLSSWKCKHSKNMKVKKKRMENHVSTSSQSAKLIVKSEQVPSDEILPQYSGDLPAINIKVEVSESDCSDRQNVMCVSGDTSLLYYEPEQMIFNELCEAANACILENQMSISLTKEPQYCATNEVCYEYMEPADPKSFQIVRASGRDSMEVDNTVPTSHEHSDFPVPESEIKGYTCPVHGDFSLETISSTADHSSYISGMPQSRSPMNDMLLQISNDIKLPSDQVFLQSSGDLWPAINMKVEVSEPDWSGCQRFICISGDPSFLCDEPEGSCGMEFSKLCETANESVSETQVSISLTEEPQCCVTNEVGYDYMELTDPKSVGILRASGGDSMKVDNTATTSHDFSDLPVLESEIEEYTHPVLDDISPETIYSATGHSSYISGISKSGYPMTIHKSPQGVELGHGGDAYAFEDGIAAELPSNPKVGVIASSISDCSLSPDSCRDSVEDDSTAEVKLPQGSPMSIHKGPQGVELGNGGDAYVFGDGIAVELPSNPKIGLIARSTSDCSLSPDSCLDSVEDDSPTAEVKQLQKSACATADINVSAGIHPFDATNEFMASVGFGYSHHSKLQHFPAMLFSTRKAISPTSRERLLKAMDSDELTDNEYYKCRGEFYFGENKFGRVEGPDQIREAEYSINPQQITRKQNNNKRGFPPRAVHKVPYLSCAVPHFSTGCTSIQSCTQSAIEFSQQQMKDFECLATKITKELQSMKDILEERLLPEACPASSLKANVDRARMAIDNATRVEESTRRWLSMMARDCKRFCKIMGLTQKGSVPSGNVVQKERKKSTFADEASGISVNQLQRLAETSYASSGNVVHKERKKITFADEVGGKLCHVRVFEDDMASSSECNNEKQELLVNQL